MDRESVERLRFDRRLERRRGWVEPAEKDAHLDSLPDVSGKMTRGFEEEDSLPAAAPASAPVPNEPAQVPRAGTFPGENPGKS